MSIKKFKFFIGIFTLILPIFLMSHNTSAVALSQINFLKAYRVQNELSGEQIFTQTATALPYNFVRIYNSWRNYSIRYFVGSSSIPSPTSGKYFQFIVYNEFVAEQNNSFDSRNCMGLDGYVLPEQGTVVNSSSRTECEISNNGKTLNVSIITNGSFNTNTSPTSFYWYLDNPNYNLYSCSNLSGSMSSPCYTQYLKLNSQNFRYNYSEDPLVAGQNIIINQNDTIINQNQQIIDQENQAYDNISNQSESDIDGATNQQTTNLIGTITNFVSALSSINTNGSCQLTLPFPSLLGGDQVVNPCSGADKAPTIISVASSLLLISLFVPLAFILIKMIYNEIRSFTNG